MHPPFCTDVEQRRTGTVPEEPEPISEALAPTTAVDVPPESVPDVIGPVPEDIADFDVPPAYGFYSKKRDTEPEQVAELPPVPRDQSTLVATSDPIATYRRRSSILQSSTSPRASVHYQLQSCGNGDGEESYIVPARSRAASIMGGQNQLLRTLATFSIHEKVEPELGKNLLAAATGEAPPSSIPKEFADTDKVA